MPGHSTAQTHDAMKLYKAQFYRSERWIHMNNAGQSPICQGAREVFETWSRRFYEEGAHSVGDLLVELARARQDLAKLLGADASEVSFFPGASAAISQVALGLKLAPGDEVIVWDQEYPSNFYPWAVACERSGAKLIVVTSGDALTTPVALIEKQVTARTKVIATSWVQYLTGAIIDLNELTAFARPRDIFTCADIIQGAGCLPFDFHASGLDAACGGSHKWMAAAHGAAYLLLRKENLERLSPIMIGAITYGTPDDRPSAAGAAKPQMRSDSIRFESGGKPFIEILALGAAARTLASASMARVSQEIEWLAKSLMHGLRERGYTIHTPHGAHHRGSIVNFSPSLNSALKDIAAVEKRLEANGISYAQRPPGVRLSPHAHNSIDDINRVLKSLE